MARSGRYRGKPLHSPRRLKFNSELSYCIRKNRSGHFQVFVYHRDSRSVHFVSDLYNSLPDACFMALYICTNMHTFQGKKRTGGAFKDWEDE